MEIDLREIDVGLLKDGETASYNIHIERIENETIITHYLNGEKIKTVTIEKDCTRTIRENSQKTKYNFLPIEQMPEDYFELNEISKFLKQHNIELDRWNKLPRWVINYSCELIRRVYKQKSVLDKMKI
jgi:hypothetical protein